MDDITHYTQQTCGTSVALRCNVFQTFQSFRACLNTRLPYAIRIQIRYIGLDSRPPLNVGYTYYGDITRNILHTFIEIDIFWNQQ